MLKELVEYLAKSLVSEPDAVNVEEVVEGTLITLKLSVAPDDMGKVIGKQGRTAKSIRTIVKAAATRQNVKVIVDIV